MDLAQRNREGNAQYRATHGSIWIDKQTLKTAKTLARRKGLKLNQIVESLVERWLTRQVASQKRVVKLGKKQ